VPQGRPPEQIQQKENIVTRRLRRAAETVLATVVAVLTLGVGMASALEPAISPDPLGTGNGQPPRLAATAVAVGLAALIVGFALGLAVQRRVQPEADRPDPGSRFGG